MAHWVGKFWMLAAVLQYVAATQQWKKSTDNEAFPEDYPYQATALIYRNPVDIRICGGSLIAEQWVLSSAACLNMCTDGDNIPEDCNSYFEVVLGTRYLQWEEPNQEFHFVEQVVLHPEYRAGYPKNDIALIKLEQPANFSEYIQPVQLPTRHFIGKSLTWTKLSLSGFGTTKDKHVKRPKFRVADTSPNTFTSTCKFVFMFEKLDSYHFCRRQQSCAAERGGSPLVTRHNNALVQLALSSGAVRNPCDRLLPALFLRLDHFLDWIREVTGLSESYIGIAAYSEQEKELKMFAVVHQTNPQLFAQSSAHASLSLGGVVER